jgi:hypothetical protein
MVKLFLVMNAQHAWELRQVYLDHVINETGPEMVVAKVVWHPLWADGSGVAMILLETATAGSLREVGDPRGLSRTGRLATQEEILSAFSAGEAGNCD